MERDVPDRRGRVTLVLALAVAWLGFNVLWPFAATVWLVCVVALVLRNRRRALIAFTLSPYLVVPVLSFAGGVLGYATGTATLRFSGLPSPEFWNVDPAYRCDRVSDG